MDKNLPVQRDSDVIDRKKQSSQEQQRFGYGNQVGTLDTALKK